MSDIRIPAAPTDTNELSGAVILYQVADLLRGDYKQSEYSKVILPFTIFRRLDCVLDVGRHY